MFKFLKKIFAKNESPVTVAMNGSPSEPVIPEAAVLTAENHIPDQETRTAVRGQSAMKTTPCRTCGKPISYNIEISENTATIDSNLKKLMQSKVGYKPFTYFDFSIMKTSDGTTSLIENTAKDLEVEVKIPKEYLKKGRKFVVIRKIQLL